MKISRLTIGLGLVAVVGLFGLVEANASPFSMFFLADDLGNRVMGTAPEASEWGDDGGDSDSDSKTKSNNGHGNNEDGVDSSNPGNSKDGEDASCDGSGDCVDDEMGNGNGDADADDDDDADSDGKGKGKKKK